MRRRPTRSITFSLRALAVGLSVGALSALASGRPVSLEAALAARGLQVLPERALWIDPPTLGPRRALVLAARGTDPDDLYAVTARSTPDGRVLKLLDVSNLTRSPDASEGNLRVAGRFAAFTTRVGTRVAAVTVLDLAGDKAPPASDLGTRARAAITRWQQTGRLSGYGVDRYDLTPEARAVSLDFDGARLIVRADTRTITLEPAAHSLVEGARFARYRPRLAGTTGALTWAVDTVRAIPWIGGAPIAWAEHLAFGLQHEVARARVRVEGDRSQDEVAEDLADVLHHGATDVVAGPVADWPPPPMRGPLSPPLAHEGEWIAASHDDVFVARSPGAPPTFYQGFVRTDPERPDTRVYVTLWDARQVELHVVPGSQEPMGATGETGSGSVPRDARTLTRLAAGFNGGFQALHGEWGVYAEGTLFLPPKPWGATIFALEGGRTGFGSWPGGTTEIPSEVNEFRQNLTALVEDGQLNPYRRTFWGGTVPGAPPGETHTARTGLCMTREGFVGFFWGNGLTERSLGDAMLAARCSYGVHLDMNGANTGFEFLRVTPTDATPTRPRPLASGEHEGPVPSAPSFTVRARRMVRGMHEMSFPRYIKRDPRDFFYLLLRPVLPGENLRPPQASAQPNEGVFSVAGLGDAPFPWPMARTRVRPDPAQPDRWVNLVRVDPRRVALCAPDQAPAPFARVVGLGPDAPQGLRIVWSAPQGGGRWGVADAGPGIAVSPLEPGATVTRGAGLDDDGFLVWAVADRGTPDLIDRALRLAGCRSRRFALPPSAALSLSGGRDAAGAAIDPSSTAAWALTLRDERGATRVFPEVTPVPQRVWYEAQHRRVRYQRSEDGAVQVQLNGGHRVSVPAWGGSTPRDAGATPGPNP
ncbi:MAG: hypothetical protein JNK72_01550 [Myxococcales bacterium]|nr:hypothetical protein [Myxococcales bacterium]